jgi:multidrug transporter EmrE-like cation transporter
MKKMEVVVLVLISVLLGVFGQLSLKQGMKNIGNFEIKDFFSARIFELVTEKFVVIGIVLYAIATLLWLVVLSKAELSFAYPMLAIGYILIAIFSKIFFGENVTFVRFLGILLISIGVFLLLKST